MTSRTLLASFQASIAALHELRQQAGFADLDLADTPELRAAAHRFALALATAPDGPAAGALLSADAPGAQAFWSLIRARWETLQTFLQPSAFELQPALFPFEALCRCELWFEEIVIATPEPSAPPDLNPQEDPGHPATELEWTDSAHTASLPGLPRPVRGPLALPDLEGETTGHP